MRWILLAIAQVQAQSGFDGLFSGAWFWSRAEATGGPEGRQGHAAVNLGSRIAVIGGCNLRCYSDVHLLDTDSLSWAQVAVTGSTPSPRGGHSATKAGDYVYTFGGADGETTFGDVHRLDPRAMVWTLASSRGVAPEPRSNHAAAGPDRRGRVYIFGGYSKNGTLLNDLWYLDTLGTSAGDFEAKWTRLATQGAPSPREGHSLTLVDQSLIVFGGSDGSATNDLHLYDLEKHTWSVARPLEPPPARQAHSAARHGRSVVVAGGCAPSEVRGSCFSDVWSYSLDNNTWSRRSASGEGAWSPREGHSANFVAGKMFAIGGCELGLECFSDVVVLDSQDPCPSSCGGHGSCVNDACVCDELGFSGHDCMDPPTCVEDCGAHGVCQSGTCMCQDGREGPTCSQKRCAGLLGFFMNCEATDEVQAPGPGKELAELQSARIHAVKLFLQQDNNVSEAEQALELERALQLVQSEREDKGWWGLASLWRTPAPVLLEATSKTVQAPFQFIEKEQSPLQELLVPSGEPVNLLEALDVAQTLMGKDGLDRAAATSLSSSGMRSFSLASGEPVAKGEAKVTVSDFGIETVAAPPSSGVCKDNCHYKGLCDKGTCFCQPGRYGTTCESIREEETSMTWSLYQALVLAGGFYVFSLGLTLICLFSHHRKKRLTETETGYNA